jgi:hypothetical protein
MFRGRYEQMFFQSNLKLERNLTPMNSPPFHWFPVLTYASKYSNLSPVTSTEDVVQHSTQREHPENTTCHKSQ